MAGKLVVYTKPGRHRDTVIRFENKPARRFENKPGNSGFLYVEFDLSLLILFFATGNVQVSCLPPVSLPS